MSSLIAAVDFETYYDEVCSIRTLGTYAYLHHADYEAYLVSIVTSDGFEWCGPPTQAPWGRIDGATWVSHNAGFDEPVYRLLQEQGAVSPGINPAAWHCTADLCAFLAAPRALAAACKYLYGEKVSKDVRTKMKGKRWQDLSPHSQQEVIEYALVDSRKCLRFWMDHGHTWPERERRLSVHTRRMCQRGLLTDVARLQEGITHLTEIAWRAGKKIPWHGREKDLSYPALVVECRKNGIEAPGSIAMDSEDCAAWEEKYGEQYAWVDAMRAKRRANALLKKLETIMLRVQPNGRAGYGLKYFGAHTGRWSGDAGWNPQNLPQGEMFGEEWFLGKRRDDGTREPAEGRNFAEMWKDGMRGVDLRKCFVPEPGSHFNIADLSQIEPRVLWALAGDEDNLRLVATGMSPYEAHARTTMGWTGGSMKKEDPEKYRLAKARVLALGYGAGFIKFITMARNYDAEACFDAPVTRKDASLFMAYLDYFHNDAWYVMWNKGTDRACKTLVNSWKIVRDFRRTNPKIVALWKKYQLLLQERVGVNNNTLEIPLPSGRCLRYRNIYQLDGEIHGTVIKSGRPQDVRLYGALIVENIVQAISRDVFAEGLLRLENVGIDTIIHIHDESVTECPLSIPPETVGSLLAQAPSWLPNLPVGTEAVSSPYYTK
jgi:DNA polymerase